jgi:hypothetical protein
VRFLLMSVVWVGDRRCALEGGEESAFTQGGNLSRSACFIGGCTAFAAKAPAVIYRTFAVGTRVCACQLRIGDELNCHIGLIYSGMWLTTRCRIQSVFLSGPVRERTLQYGKHMVCAIKSGFEPWSQWGFPPKYHLIDSEKVTPLPVSAQLDAKVFFGKSYVTLRLT